MGNTSAEQAIQDIHEYLSTEFSEYSGDGSSDIRVRVYQTLKRMYFLNEINKAVVEHLQAEHMQILVWLEYWRDKMPNRAATELQDILSAVPK